MKCLILNSGLGFRMRPLTKEHPKCMTGISVTDTILSRQLKLLAKVGVSDVVITTGYFDDVLIKYCLSLNLPLNYEFVKNPLYAETNYIYSIYCAKEILKEQDVLLMHGDLVFEFSVLKDIISNKHSCMKVSSTVPPPEKDFKAVVEHGFVKKVGVEFFGKNAIEAQALYKLNSSEWQKWLDEICRFCEAGHCNCYAEVALNQITEKCEIMALDVKERLCTEIDTPDDLKLVTAKLEIAEKQ